VIRIPTSPPNVIHVPAIVAKDLRLYKKAGLDVEIVSLGDSTKGLSRAARWQYQSRWVSR
jgi:ABC-type nitrate/sulfonate/bicarbonate transport system substrate-binding protein